MSLSRFERELLASGKTSAPSAERRQAAKVAVMRAAGVAAAAATLTASSTAGGATAGATASATATSGVKALGVVKLVLLAVVTASAIGAVAAVTLRSSAPTGPAMIAAPDVSAAIAMGQDAPASAAPTTSLDDSPPAIASVPVSSLPNAPASASAPASARTAPSPAASAPREPATEEDPLATEARILEAARACLAKGDRACAQAKLDEHEARFARGPLADEAALLAIDVALAGGDRPKARRLARSLVARSPHGAWNARVKALAQEEDGPP